MTGAAPIAKEVVHYFLSLDIQILELYGMNLDLLFLFNIYFYYHLSTYNAFMSIVKIKIKILLEYLLPECMCKPHYCKRAFTYDVRCFLSISDLPTYPNQI